MARKSKAPESSPSSTRGPFVVTLLVLLGVVMLAARARREAELSPRFAVDPTRVEIAARPDWLPLQLSRIVGSEVSAPLDAASLISPEGLAPWHEALALHPWVDEVVAVEPLFPGRARVRLRLARPVLELPGESLVAADGRLVGYGQVAVEPTPLRLAGPDGPEHREACAAGAAELLPYRADLLDAGLEIVEVESLGAGKVVFRTRQGVRIDWGRPLAVSPYPEVDLPVSSRIGHLEEALRSKPGLIGVARVELWGQRPRLHLTNG